MRGRCWASARARSTATTTRPFDHAINPSWSPDGKTHRVRRQPRSRLGQRRPLVGRRCDDPPQRRKILVEETSWSARPELAPDGKRVLFASYHGRQTHQLWLTTLQGAAPLPLTFGDSERRNARWSPDGRRIAYIGNGSGNRPDGNTSLVVMDVVGGATQRGRGEAGVVTLTPAARLALDILDGARTAACRRACAVQGSDGRAHAPTRRLDACRRRLRPREAGDRDALLPLRIALHAGRACRCDAT